MITRLLDLLTPDRTTVPQICTALTLTRPALAALLTAQRDDLAAAGVVLHTATHAETTARRAVKVDGAYIVALSRPARATGLVGQVVSLLDRVGASVEELRQLRQQIDVMIDAVAPVAPPAIHYSYVWEQIRGTGAYFLYGYYRQDGQLKKKYIRLVNLPPDAPPRPPAHG
jgi:hypothetical protein